MGRLFGTDGVRGLANGDLTADLALRLSIAAAHVLAAESTGGGTRRPTAVVGRDPRASGEMLQAAVTAGLTSAGIDVLDVGVLPTPAVAYLTGLFDASLGVMISASHNPMPDNGIKIFAAGGHKLDDDVEAAIEAAIDGGVAPKLPTGAGIGRVRPVGDAAALYLQHLGTALTQPLDGLTVVVDCANGAASEVGPAAYRAAGATVIAISAEPDGLNINDGCGSTHLENLQKAVVEHGADLGLAHDGDADRCLAVDETGAVIDGDVIMAVLAVAMHESGELVDNTLVATVMSNLGLHLAMRAAGIDVVTAAVGDRYVLEELRTGGYSLGGEQSGHVVFPGFGTTGDGVLTGLRLLARMAQTGKSSSQLAATMTSLPQVLVNVRVEDKAAVAAATSVMAAVADAERVLGDAGRVLLRPSGTEQLVRVMVEAADLGVARKLADELAETVAAV
ncbi:phosphoglucosamine mutase [Rhodococcus sp. ACPA4]|jgi:phosphoglucosamine mutase|uniref:Phosphoglucosamine mutase n=2 Tax=Nocardiaceae TaxID=85025 RepID=A0A652YX55_NOCGL|nr:MULTISPECIES: phosphoglucosamine mutase [Rhodococcus]NMD59344.1 phosphoglucosamine mutase [Nocardia globerula]MDV6270557.1 phosphoglucosamine mutase [Rhodococcus globerulus]NRI69488.1 phosphoglucosamine mutase [Rhodococcus sp. MS16]PBC41924.1 phosphoglucosamine mutase [Rhodococcus sp. ACPA4]PVX64585.1 phosphoglucosamine mutase [Rhodococcus globerulus]